MKISILDVLAVSMVIAVSIGGTQAQASRDDLVEDPNSVDRSSPPDPDSEAPSTVNAEPADSTANREGEAAGTLGTAGLPLSTNDGIPGLGSVRGGVGGGGGGGNGGGRNGGGGNGGGVTGGGLIGGLIGGTGSAVWGVRELLKVG